LQLGFGGVDAGRVGADEVDHILSVGHAQGVGAGVDGDLFEMVFQIGAAAFEGERAGAHLVAAEDVPGERFQLVEVVGAVGGGDERAARLQDACDLRHGAVLVGRVVEHVHRQHDVEGVVGEGERADVGLPAGDGAEFVFHRGDCGEGFVDHALGLVGEREVDVGRQRGGVDGPKAGGATADVEHFCSGGDEACVCDGERLAGRAVFDVDHGAGHEVGAVLVLALHLAHDRPRRDAAAR